MTSLPHKSGNKALMAVCLSFLVPGAEARAGDQSDLLSLVRAQHRAARESIRTLSATMTDETRFPKRELFMRGKYWRSFNMVRVQEFHSDTKVSDGLLKDSEIRFVGRRRIGNDRYDQYTAWRSSSADSFCICDAWRYMLIEFYGPSEKRYDFDRFIDLARAPPRLRRETMDGHECVRLDMQIDTDAGNEWSITFWHDVKRNYLVRKEVAIFARGIDPYEYEILEFLEAAPGVFVPVRARLRGYEKGKLTTESVITLSEVRVNEGLPRHIFALPSIPDGTVVLDHIERTRYPVDRNWRRIGPATPFEPIPVRPSRPGPGGDFHAQTQEEPKSLLRWLVTVSLLLLAGAGAYRLYAHHQSRKDQASGTPAA